LNVQPNYYASSPAIQAAGKSSDPQVQKLMSQIKDWEFCPTTDPQTKKKKVDALESQLSSVEASLDKQSKVQAQVKGAPGKEAIASGNVFEGKGLRLDVAA
jgi:hypothetical protein